MMFFTTSLFIQFTDSVIFKDALKSFREQWKCAKSGPLAACRHRPAACRDATQFLLFCVVAKLEYRKTGSCVSTHVWHVPLDCRIFTHWSTRDQGCTDDFSPGQGVFGHLKSLLSHKISTCSQCGCSAAAVAAGSSGYLHNWNLPFLQSNSITFTTWTEVVSGEADLHW